MSVAPGWPPEVRPPVAPDWERSAVAWLLDRCPPDYRAYAVLPRHPVALAWLALHHLEGARRATDRALAVLRADLAEDLPPPAISEVVEAVEAEQARLIGDHRAAGLVLDALRGLAHVPRLRDEPMGRRSWRG